jgi:uncharacterized membrane protein
MRPVTAPTRHAASATVSLGVVLACVVGTLVVGAALKAPCATGDWADGRQYTFLCYSDIVPLLGTEQLFDQGGRLPFIDACEVRVGQNCDEYPVVTMFLIRAAGWISGEDSARFFAVNALLLLGCAVVIAVCLYVLTGARALFFALAPTLLIYGTVNWDLLAVALATVAMVLFFRKRDAAAGAALGLGAATKFYPGLLVVPLIAQRLRERAPDRAIVLGWSSAGSWLLVNLPFALVAWSSWYTFFRFNAQRFADFDSLWFIACRHVEAACLSVRSVNIASLVSFIALFAGVWAIAARRRPDFPRWTLGFPMIVLFLLTSKVYSPQYGLWLLPWFALALPRVREFVLFEIADVAVFVSRFWFFGWLGGGFGTPQWLFETMVLVRAAVLVWCIAMWIRTEAEPLSMALPSTSLAAQPKVQPA